MSKTLGAIGVVISITFTPIVLAPMAAMAQRPTAMTPAAQTPTAMTPAQMAAMMAKKYPATAAARAHPVSGQVRGDVVYWPAPKSTPTAGTAKTTGKATHAAAKPKSKTAKRAAKN